MSAYIVDPRTIDYLVAWTHRDRAGNATIRTGRVWGEWEDVPEEFEHAVIGSDRYGYCLDLLKITKDQLGEVLMRANVRSVAWRYRGVAPEDLPGPVNQKRIWSYRFQSIPCELKPAWVIKSCLCLGYQSCEHLKYRRSLAEAITEAIREDAIRAVTEDAPWGVTDKDFRGDSELSA